MVSRKQWNERKPYLNLKPLIILWKNSFLILAYDDYVNINIEIMLIDYDYQIQIMSVVSI